MAYLGYVADNQPAFESYATSYTNFTTSLVTSTFEALLDATIQQLEAYTDMIGTMSKDMTTYINDTQDEVHDEDVLQLLEMLPLGQAGAIGAGNTIGIDYSSGQPELVELPPPGSTATPTLDIKKVGEAISGITSGGLVGAAVNSIRNLVKLPDAVENEITTLKDLNSGLTTGTITAAADINRLIFKAVAQRIASNKYAMLENMVRLGFQRLVVDKGVVETTLNMSFSEVSKFSKVQKDKVKNKEKKKTKAKSRPGFASFLFRKRNKSREKMKHVHLEVNKTKTKESEVNKGKAATTALVRIEFSSDYQPLATS